MSTTVVVSGSHEVSPETTATTTVSLATLDMDTFQGYGDYSGLTYHQVDWFAIYSAAVRCAQDHGFPVRLTDDGGANFQDVQPDQNQLASLVFETCLKAMNAPEWTWPTEEEIRYKYAYALALIPCIQELGYEVDEPPSVDVYIDTWQTGPWTPFSHVPSTGPEAAALAQKCPASPVGGAQAWQPGDPIAPIPDGYSSS